MQPLIIQLFSKLDTDSQTYHIGKCRWPGKLYFRHGTTFLIYIDGEDKQELHITTSDDESIENLLHQYTQGRRKQSRSRHQNICINLEPILDEDNKIFYLGHLMADLSLDASEGLVFLCFTADEGDEELQISVPSKRKK
jgi:hypothetical protein